ncbi:flavin reductase [candidate division KSB1 bacterium]|nr:flavin reductase [candidate division KSB1 bacterium]
MAFKSVAVDAFTVRIYDLWKNQWLLLTSGDWETRHFNAMTVAWGSFGIMWNKPFAQVVVRPTRYTYEFMEKYPTFTLCAFSSQYRSALQLLGNKSGREGDKISESGLSPMSSTIVRAPCFAEAQLILECRKIYQDDFNYEHFLDASIAHNYPQRDYHRIYFGEILAILQSV